MRFEKKKEAGPALEAPLRPDPFETLS